MRPNNMSHQGIWKTVHSETPEFIFDDVTEFVFFKESDFEGISIKPEFKSYLIENGLPRESAPFLCFSKLYFEHYLHPKLPIGSNGIGDFILLNTESGVIFYENHDNFNKSIFINSNLISLFECLCIFQKAVIEDNQNDVLPQLLQADNNIQNDSMWHHETANKSA